MEGGEGKGGYGGGEVLRVSVSRRVQEEAEKRRRPKKTRGQREGRRVRHRALKKRRKKMEKEKRKRKRKMERVSFLCQDHGQETQYLAVVSITHSSDS